jgi:histidinol-phosphate aminotransferase
MVDLVLKGENVIVSRTRASCSGSPGCACGFAIARPDIVARLSAVRHRRSERIRPARGERGAARYRLSGLREAEEPRRARPAARRAGVAGSPAAPSQTNFVFFHAGKPVEQMQRYFTERGFPSGARSRRSPTGRA